MTVGQSENHFRNSLIRYGLWTIGLVSAFIVSVYMGTSLSAYNDEGEKFCKWRYDENTTLDVPYRYDPIHADYRTAFRGGIEEWDDSDTSAEFVYRTSQTKHRLGDENRPESEYLGATTASCWLFKRSRTYAWLNRAFLDDESARLKRSIATHELGHYIGIRHSTESPSVMNLDRNHERVYRVYEDDECAVNDRYEHEDYPVTCDD